MLRPACHRRKVRADHCLSVPDSAIDAAQAWHRPRSVSSMFAGTAGFVFPSREIESDQSNLRGGCGPGASPFLDAILARTTLHEPSPTADGASAGGGSGRHGECVDQAQEEAGAGRDIMRRSLAATGTTGRTPVRGRRTGTTLPRTRTTTSGCGAPVTHMFRSAVATAQRAVHSVWSAGLVLLRGIHLGVWHNADYCNMERRGQHL